MTLVTRTPSSTSKRTTGTPIRRVLDERLVTVVYQPLVDLKTKKIFAYEALVRSKSPEFNSPPALFDAAVENDCTGKLGRVIREMAVDGCPTHPLFLNIHPAELNDKWVVQPDDPIFQHEHDVYLEITEGVPLSHFRLCQSILREVRGRGIYLVVAQVDQDDPSDWVMTPVSVAEYTVPPATAFAAGREAAVPLRKTPPRVALTVMPSCPSG